MSTTHGEIDRRSRFSRMMSGRVLQSFIYVEPRPQRINGQHCSDTPLTCPHFSVIFLASLFEKPRQHANATSEDKQPSTSSASAKDPDHNVNEQTTINSYLSSSCDRSRKHSESPCKYPETEQKKNGTENALSSDFNRPDLSARAFPRRVEHRWEFVKPFRREGKQRGRPVSLVFHSREQGRFNGSGFSILMI